MNDVSENCVSVSLGYVHTVYVSDVDDGKGNRFTTVRIVPKEDDGRSLTLCISAGMELGVAMDGLPTIPRQLQTKDSTSDPGKKKK